MTRPTLDPASDAAINAMAVLQPIETIARKLAIPEPALYRYGPYKAKLDRAFCQDAAAAASGKLVLVTAISPTPAGEGKTTTTIGLGDALAARGVTVAICLREPSLGPCFGAKGGATGGGQAQIAPMDEINLHFTGDLHAIGSAHNLLAAMLDNHIYWGNALAIDSRRITWGRAVDLNDRALRRLVIGIGDGANGAAREDHYDITVASEVMAILCLSASLDDLAQRLGRIVVARRRDGSPVTAADLNATGAMTALLRDAFQPNLVQTLEGTPALVHGGPFANIAHGCNSVIATRTALGLADIVVTEAGFGADLGAEKFIDIKCRSAGLAPAAAVVVATLRALKMHGGVDRDALGVEDVAAVERGFANLARHVRNLRRLGVPVVVAVNHYPADTPAEFAALARLCADDGVTAIDCRHWAHGGSGARDLAEAVMAMVEGTPPPLRPLYPLTLPLADKIAVIARDIYGAASVAIAPAAAKSLQQFTADGYGGLPVCMAKTQYSFSADPSLRGAPDGFVLPVREARLSAGAGFVVALAGDVMTMPGLPRRPAAEGFFLDAEGRIGGMS